MHSSLTGSGGGSSGIAEILPIGGDCSVQAVRSVFPPVISMWAKASI